MEKLPAGKAGKTGKYFKYAIGEIILVVIGILIALQVNNWNIERTDKDREAKYLSTIVLDLKKDLVRLDYLINFRKNRVLGDQKLIQQINGEPINNVTNLAKNVVNSLMEENFSANNTTFLELSNSGNLNLISNDAIKLLLLELEELYKTNNLNIAHETFDYREYISKPASKHLDIEKLFPVFIGQKTVEEQKITIDSFNSLLKSKEYKNGLFIMTIMSSSYIASYEKMKSKSETIIKLIQFKK
ncbi:DUF6090 family protein [Polaribacter glomeratus]|uniref:Uncharacterized protein n=1 Tax=Polaribacter glomeratus TaxID=102 RepID=A0A2S7WI73_9FLAO|nr:DUF6090 family protein [Polaribacter glomeratus]PQJ77303.1 hypothetical protein BTO16_15820 [Polaribacter glomeratus]TXD65887.1 hypothetical protein ESX12_06925 [Polaribacter glomeratus]